MRYLVSAVETTDYPEVVAVWEASVRATHDFLTEADIQFYKPLILHEYLQAVNLFCVKDETAKIQGFIGVAERKVEMLFINPAARGKGIGHDLIKYVIEHENINAVDVNEQNPQAVGFYRHMGFRIAGRSATDGMGKPFPILFMTLEEK
ncbi:MAG: GNAT family N-acetyltransferase [Chitinophaga sp.]|uniref:GNAT family N-acetyltransferase n=1 Tax=Chitinophaga sp. TaxID=1869181 RepID=UPI001B020132|nr:GNAT family N-acetyltransferase [Chitinophaga sp.]MBO9729240.1 GNAT family N-acetyltransferase [Chitinophaga sp.]